MVKYLDKGKRLVHLGQDAYKLEVSIWVKIKNIFFNYVNIIKLYSVSIIKKQTVNGWNLEVGTSNRKVH